ncbi:MAG TPA: GNAT family N-acetyltransferase [Candidatus Sulfotelmatobacter sp.]
MAASNSLPPGATSAYSRQFTPSSKTRFFILHEFPPPDVQELWSAFLSRIDSPSHYDAPEYFLEPQWAGNRPFVILAFHQGDIVGVASGLHLHGNTACGVLSRPQIRVDPTHAVVASSRLSEGLLQEAGKEKLITVFAWNWVPLQGLEQQGFRRRELEGDVVLDLKLGSDAIYKQFHENRKRNIRAALNHGIEVTEANRREDLTAYWEVYSRWRRTERKQIVHNLSFAIIEQVHHLRHNHRRFLARHNGKVIAATGLRFQPCGMVEYANNCSLDEFIHLRPNDLLLWRTIEWACQKGFTKYSLGAAHPFLRKSGGTVIPICRYRLDRSLFHQHDLKDSARSQARSILAHLPAGIGNGLRKLSGNR